MSDWLNELATARLDPDDPNGRDPEFIEKYGQPICRWVRDQYFRVDVEDIENVPTEAPFIAIANHSAAPMLPDVWPMLATWWDRFPLDVPSYALVHDIIFRVPIVGNLLIKLGALRATTANAERVLDRGGVLLIFPGGDTDALRSYWQRNVVDLRGRTGFVKLAMRYQVPLLPVVNVGGSETSFTLMSSPLLAQVTGMRRLLRVKSMPINAGLPWGIWVSGFVPFLPLPAKITYKVAPPIAPPDGPERADDDVVLGKVYEEVVTTMQSMVDDLASRRRFPVLG